MGLSKVERHGQAPVGTRSNGYRLESPLASISRFCFLKETVRRAVMRVSFIPPQRIKEDDTAKLALAYFLPVCLDLKIFWPRRKETHNVCGRE